MYVLTGKRSVGVGGKIFLRGDKIQDNDYKELPKRVKKFFEKENSGSAQKKEGEQKNNG